MPVPTRAQWKTLKTACGVPDGAVSGVDVGKALDTFASKYKLSVKNAPGNAAAALALEKVLAGYIAKLKKDKVKQYSKFQSTFMKDYVTATHNEVTEWKRYAADVETLGKEILTVVSAAQRLPVGKTTAADLQQFLSGPLRGMSAVGRPVKGVDMDPINDIASKMADMIGNAGEADAAQLERMRNGVAGGMVEIVKRAKAQNIL